eukprot:CAMPEP_0197187430 /NCGR_PEP_ID=MMETSP1423-20130617/15825_1 /TAXON_ID=476441 /ORGANISM="Pseudo-nitzschia heimii, Strain UNC1101" /LENGTH=250 /DNA_ID=CAMNT_0042638995 /DNA_START=132 /DNA_END=881 /DNA_ORIENTATION=+
MANPFSLNRSKRTSPLFDLVTTTSEYENDGFFEYNYDDADAKSQFGTKEYWDDQYQGRGDFPMDEYQWYYGFERYGKFLQTHIPSKNEEILIPGIGNDPILLYLLQKGYGKLTATDYSEHAIERQKDLLSHQRYPFSTEISAESDRTLTDSLDSACDDDVENKLQRPTTLVQMDAREMPVQWAEKFDAIVEKGTLDAIFLSGDGNADRAAKEFRRTLKPGGILITMSCVVPVDVRKEIFRNWTWIRDGSE